MSLCTLLAFGMNNHARIVTSTWRYYGRMSPKVYALTRWRVRGQTSAQVQISKRVIVLRDGPTMVDEQDSCYQINIMFEKSRVFVLPTFVSF